MSFSTTIRKGWLRALALLFVMALVATACGSSDDGGSSEEADAPADDTTAEDAPADDAPAEDTPADDEGPIQETTEPSEGEPVRGGTLRFGLEAEGEGLNPTTNTFAVAGLQMGELVFDGLAKWSADDVAVPWLAESITPSDDLLTHTIKLRPGITFTDGTPVDADAVIVNSTLQITDPLVGLAVRPFLREEDPVTKVDDLTVEYHTRTPTSDFARFVTGQVGFVASPAWLEAAAEDPSLNQFPIGSGPFKIESRTQDDKTVFVRNDDWWGGEVYLDSIEFFPIPQSARRTDQLLAGDLDILHTTDAPDTELLLDEDDIVTVLDDTGEESFWMLNTSKPPFDDIRARQAARFASPQEEYLELIDVGTRRRADQFFTPESPFHNPDVVQETDMPEMAAPLVEAYCADVPDQCTDGKINTGWTFAGPSQGNQDVADLVSRSWEPYFNVTQDEVLQDDQITTVALGAWQATQWRQMGIPDPDQDMTWLQCDTIGGLSLNWPRQCDEARDELLLAQRAETDPAVRAQLWQEIVANVDEGAAYILMSHTLWTISHTQQVQNLCGATTPEGDLLRCTVNGRQQLWQVWLEE